MTHSLSYPSLSTLRCSLLASAVSLIINPVAADQAVAATIQVGGSCSLVDAITSANTDTSINNCTAGDPPPATDTLVLQNSSVHTLDTVNDPSAGGNGLPLIKSAVTIQGNGSTITRSKTAPDFRLLYVTQTGSLTLDNVTISNGSVTGWGGGILNLGTVRLDNGTTLSGNKATDGGGLFNYANSSAVLNNSTISGNIADNGGGLINFWSNVTVNDSTVSGNSASVSVSPPSPTLSPKGGGGVFNFHSTVKMTNSTISHNSAGSSSGGGFLNYGGTVTLNSCTISNNSAGNGGGVLNHMGTVTVTNSTLTGNRATLYGAGLINNKQSVVTLTNSTVSGNSAYVTGGVMTVDSTVTLNNCTVTGNRADPAMNGSNLFNFSNSYPSTVKLSNTIIANSLGGSDCSGPIIDQVANWFEDNSCGRTGNGDPALGPLADNGGPTRTHAVLKDSGAIDAGDNGVCAAAPVNNLDQRGITRPQGEKCDIGSFEYKGSKFFVIPARNGKTVIFKL